MNNEEKIRLKNNWEWCQKYFERKSKELKLEGWILKKDHAKKRLGQTNFTRKHISISTYFLRGPSCDHKAIRNTVLHEIAHALVGFSHHHDKVWKEKALSIGCDTKICQAMDVPPPTYLMYCPKRCFKKGYYRKVSIEGKICSKCNQNVKIKKL
jgi:predicted SprT family Zn-dependent metalloprotease